MRLGVLAWLVWATAAVSWDGGNGAPLTDAAVNVGSLRTLGTGALQAAAGTDARLSDSRSPNGAASGDLAGSYPGPTLATSGVGAGWYGLLSGTVDAKGRLTYATATVTGTIAGTVSAGDHAHAGYQASDAELDAIAGLVSSADTAPYFTGSGTASLAPLTAAGRTLIAGATAAAQRYALAFPDPSAIGGIVVDGGDRFYRLANGTTGQVLTATTGSTPTWEAAGVVTSIFAGDGVALSGGPTGNVTVSVVGASPTTGVHQNLIVWSYDTATVTVTADGITLNSTTSTTPMWAASVNVSASPAAAGVGGLDTGSEAASTWYSIWLVGKGNAGAAPSIGCVLSTQTSAPGMPSGYTHYRLVGWGRNDGSSNLLPFYQRGAWVRWRDPTPAVLSAGSATTYTSVDVSAVVPPGATRFLAIYDCVSTGASRTLWIRPTGDAWFSGNGQEYQVTSTAAQESFSDVVVVSAARSFDYKVMNAALSVYIYRTGFYFDGL